MEDAVKHVARSALSYRDRRVTGFTDDNPSPSYSSAPAPFLAISNGNIAASCYQVAQRIEGRDVLKLVGVSDATQTTIDIDLAEEPPITIHDPAKADR